MAVRTPSQAIAWGNTKEIGYVGLCLVFVRECFGIAAKYPTAAASWANAKKRHRTGSTAGIPAGVPIHFQVPGLPEGHVALYVGGGRMRTNLSHLGTVGTVTVAWYQQWARAVLLGWTEDLNGVTVYTPPKAAKQPTDYRELAVDGKLGPVTVKALQVLLRAIGKYTRAVDGSLGGFTVKALQAWLGVAVDGDLGPVTVKALQRFLAKRGHYSRAVDGSLGGFTVKGLQAYLNTQNGS